MSQFFKSLFLVLLTEQCYDEYFLNFNFMDVPCMKSTISKGLGVAIIGGSFLVKLPQIIKIFTSKSGEGINITSVMMELFAITATVAYSCVSGFPFSSWGDGVFLGIQTAIVAALVLYYGGHEMKALLFLMAYASVMFISMSGLTPISVLWFCQACNIPIGLTGKLMQAHTNYQNGSTGQLSAVTSFLLLSGSAARIFTSIQETGDITLILMFVCSTFANLIIVLQLLYYWTPKTVTHKHSKKD